MTGPLAQQFASLWERLNWICSDSLDLPLTLGNGDTALNAQTPEMGEVSAWFAESRDALSVIERHVQDMEKALRETLNLAQVCVEGDPWYAEDADINAEALFARARAALPASDTRNPRNRVASEKGTPTDG